MLAAMLPIACRGGQGAASTGPGGIVMGPAIDLAKFKDARPSAAAFVATSAQVGSAASTLLQGAEPRSRLVVLASDLDSAAGVDAMVAPDDGVRAAVDLALLWSHGIQPPQALPLGAQVVTPANRAAGGERRPAAGDLMLQVLRSQHPEELTTTPTIDVVFRIAFVATSAAAGRLRPTVAAAVKRYPQLELAGEVGPTVVPAELAALVSTAGSKGCRAVLVAVDAEGEPVPAAAKAAADAGQVALLVLDPLLREQPATCRLGGDLTNAGRALGEQLCLLLPGGGSVVEITASGSDRSSEAVRAGLLAAIGNPATK